MSWLQRAGFLLMVLCWLGGCASRPPAELTRPDPVWMADFQHPISWHKTLGDDLLVVGTTRHLFGIDPRTGQRLWRLRNVNTTARDVYAVVAEPYLLVNDAAGGAFEDAGTHILAVDRVDGVLLWESPVLSGRVLQARLDLENDRLFAVTVRNPHGDDRGLLHDVLPNKGLFSGFEREPELVLIDLIDGQVRWRQPFGREVLMRPAIRPGTGGAGARADARPFDLGLYHAPVLVGDQICVTYNGIHCYRASDGTPTWSDRYDVIEDELALSYPDPVVDDRLLITGDTERLYGWDPVTGDRQWRSEELGRIPELIDDDNLVLVQVGGRYFDLDDEEWVSRGNFAAAAINKRNGRLLWHHDRVRRSISNLMLVDAYVWFADEEHLLSVDRLDGSVSVRVPHRLGEPPLYVTRNKGGQIVLVSESEAGGYDPDSGRLLWYESYPAPGPGVWKRLGAALMSASGAIFKLSTNVLEYGGLSLKGKGVIKDATGSAAEYLLEKGDEMSAERGFANLSGGTQYFLTRPRGVDEVALAAIDLNAGKTRELTILPSQNPSLVVDEINGLVYQADGQRLVAVPLGR